MILVSDRALKRSGIIGSARIATGAIWPYSVHQQWTWKSSSKKVKHDYYYNKSINIIIIVVYGQTIAVSNVYINICSILVQRTC